MVCVSAGEPDSEVTMSIEATRPVLLKREAWAKSLPPEGSTVCSKRLRAEVASI